MRAVGAPTVELNNLFRAEWSMAGALLLLAFSPADSAIVLGLWQQTDLDPAIKLASLGCVVARHGLVFAVADHA